MRLDNIVLPQLHDEARRIALTLDEREREEHARLRRARTRAGLPRCRRQRTRPHLERRMSRTHDDSETTDRATPHELVRES